jgi:hypothetical protein
MIINEVAVALSGLWSQSRKEFWVEFGVGKNILTPILTLI